MPMPAPMIIFVAKTHINSNLKKIGPSLTHTTYTVVPSTLSASVKSRSVFVRTSATSVMGHTLVQCADKLKTKFNPLPVLVPTPVNVAYLADELQTHPDKNAVKKVVDGFIYGFDSGYNGPEFSNTTNNLKSADSHMVEITENILAELEAGRMAGPFYFPPLEDFRTSPIGVVPKKDSKKFRTITDLSSPKGISINDFISDSESSVQFDTFDKAVDIVAKLGRGTLLAKLDVKSAFRICPVHPANWHLLGLSFKNLYFVDLCLPFGLRSSVNRFCSVSDMIMWILRNNYNVVNATHYLDDFLFAGSAGTSNCLNSINIATKLFENLSIPLSPEKYVAPTTTITYLGITIDSQAMEIRLPDEKLESIMALLVSWQKTKKCTKRELLSLIGKLSFAAKVVPSGRTFIRRLIDLAKSVSRLSHHISLNDGARQDIDWWLQFLPTWNGKQKILDPFITLCPDINLYTDASGCLGFGIYFNGHWISQRWPPGYETYSIQWKELFPIYVTCVIWQRQFSGKRLLFHCDNKAVVNIWSADSTRSPVIMSLIRKLFYIAAKNEFTVNVQHIPGTSNLLADSLSRLQVQKFLQLAPAADRQPTPVPCQVWNL